LCAQAPGRTRGARPAVLPVFEPVLRAAGLPPTFPATIAPISGAQGVSGGAGGIDLGNALWPDTGAARPAAGTDRRQPPHGVALAAMVVRGLHAVCLLAGRHGGVHATASQRRAAGLLTKALHRQRSGAAHRATALYLTAH